MAQSLQEEFVGVVTRVESRRGRMGERHPVKGHDGAGVEGLFESLLSESFNS